MMSWPYLGMPSVDASLLTGAHAVIGGCQCMQVGQEVPDVDVPMLGRAFEVTQELLKARQISAGHDISDGGIITALLEMAFAGDCGLAVRIAHHTLAPVSLHL